MTLRKSLLDTAHMVKDVPYKKPLPIALIPLHAYVIDTGHCIMSVPEVFLEQAIQKGCELYEVPLPVRYVLEKGWKAIDGTDAICVDVPYDKNFGAMVPDGYEEF